MRVGMAALLAAVVALGACATTKVTPVPQAPTRPGPPVEVRMVDETDPCEERRRYGDGVCDEFCPEVDPDCDPKVCLLTSP